MRQDVPAQITEAKGEAFDEFAANPSLKVCTRPDE